MACLCGATCFFASCWKSCDILPSRSQWASMFFSFFGRYSKPNSTFWWKIFLQLPSQVAASMQKETDGIPNYPNLPSKLICMLHSVTLHVWEPSTLKLRSYFHMCFPLKKVTSWQGKKYCISDVSQFATYLDYQCPESVKSTTVQGFI